MPNFSGTVTASQGVKTIDVTPNDVVTFTPTSATYSVEYPIGTAGISAATTTQTLTGNTSATQMRILCVSGSVAYSCVDVRDDTSTLTSAAAAAAQAVYDAGGAGFPAYEGFVSSGATDMDSTLVGFNGVQAWSRAVAYATQPLSTVYLTWGNFYVSSGGAETVGAGSFDITASIEYPAGTFTQVKFGGVAQGTCAAGAVIKSDAVNVSIPRGARYWIRQWFNSAAKAIHYQNITNIADTTNGEAFAFSTTTLADPTMGGAMVDAGAAGLMIRPLCITGQTTKPSFLFVGDSRISGSAEGVVGGFNLRGDVAKAIGRLYGYASFARGGALASAFNGGSTRQRALLSYATHIIAAHGINDITAGNAAATVSATLQTYYGLLAATGAKVIGVTFPPEVTTTTDAYATVANQTASARNAARVTVNTTVRSVPSPLWSYIELADAVESSRGSGLWKAPGYTTDGTHETPYANYANAPLIVPAQIL